MGPWVGWGVCRKPIQTNLCLKRRHHHPAQKHFNTQIQCDCRQGTFRGGIAVLGVDILTKWLSQKGNCCSLRGHKKRTSERKEMVEEVKRGCSNSIK